MSFLKNLGLVVKSAFTSSGLETPNYTSTVINEDDQEKTYEVRDYPETVWVSTTVKAMSHKDGTSVGFRRLFGYIQGKNEKGKEIEMTAPVAVKVVAGDGPNCKSAFTVSFYIGDEHRDNPPQPSSSDVFIDRWSPMRVYARTFGGFADDEKWVQEADKLAKSINDNDTYTRDYFYTAGYDAPFKLFNRRNEVWFVKKQEKNSED